VSVTVQKQKDKKKIKELLKQQESIVADLQNLEKQEGFIFRTKADIIRNWAKLLDDLRKEGEYSGAKNTICNYIVTLLRDTYKLSHVYVWDVLDNDFKDPEMVRRAEFRQPNITQSQNENVLGISEQDKKVLHPVLLKPTINLIDLPKEEIQNRLGHIQKAKRELDREYKVLDAFADIHNIALPKEAGLDNCSVKNKKIVKTPKDQPKESESTKAMDEMIEDMERFLHDMKEVREKIFEFPPADKKFDREFSRGVRMFSIMLLKPFHSYMQPVKDEKWAQVYPEWWKTQQFNNVSGKHAAGKKSAVESISGQLRKLTREQVGDREYKMYEQAKLHSRSVKFFEHLWEWHNKYVRPRIAQRRIDLSPKLQEQA